jgi:hypothetical protein
MASTTHPNQLDTRRGLRAGLVGLGIAAVAAVAALGFSVVAHDSETAPAAVDFPTVDEMRAENMEIRQATGAGVAGAAAAPAAVDFPTVDEMRAENQIIRDQVAAAAAAAEAADDPDLPVPPVDETHDEDQVIRPTKQMP